MFAEPRIGNAEAGASLFEHSWFFEHPWPHPEAQLAAQLGRRATGAMRERHRRTVDRPAATIVVGNCEDSGAGSLRDAVAGAVSGDVIDLSQLTCSTITLAGGGIIAAVDNIDLVGPGAAALTIDAGYHSRAFYHLGSGTLGLSGLNVAHGAYAGGPYYQVFGGCVFSKGSVYLSDSIVSGCALNDAITDGSGSAGGGVFAYYSVTLVDSEVTACTITASGDDVVLGAGIFAIANVALLRSRVSGNMLAGATGPAYGGGIFAIANLNAKYSTISDNSAIGYMSEGGGARSNADVYLLASTVSGNYANVGAGLMMRGSFSENSAQIHNSTISGNVAAIVAGGAAAVMPLQLTNSTIAFNTSVMLNVSGLYIGADTEIESSIIANNSAATTQRDLGGSSNASITGANNLIRVTFLTVPGDTLSVDPLLAPLANNGGRTSTHALTAASPAIDAGNNVEDFSRDQRGSGFARVVGANADIGAFETDPDRIFVNGFDG